MPSAHAATETWLGNTSVFFNAANWSGTNNPPLSGDSLVFGTAGTAGSTLTDNLMTPGTFNIAGITFNSGAPAFTINTNTAGTNGFTLTGSVTNNSTSLETINDLIDMTAVQTFTTGGGNITLGGIVSGTGGGITKAGSGTLTLSGANTYTGATTVSAGTLQVDGSLAAASTVGIGTAGTLSGSGTINGNVTLTGGGTINLTSPGNIAGTLGVTGGTLKGAGSVTGAVTSSSGIFTIATGANLTATGGLNVTGGTITANNVNSTITGSVNYTSSSSSSFGGVIAGSGSSLIMNNAAATLTLFGHNTFDGNVNVLAGTLEIAGRILQSSNAATITVASGATLLVSSTATNALGYQGTEQWVVAGTINATAANTGGLAFPGGGVTLNGGTLTGVVSNGAGGTYFVNGAAGAITANGTDSLISAGDVAIQGVAFGVFTTLTLATPLAGDTLTASSVFRDRTSTTGGKITKTGAGTVIMTGASTYTGTTTISGGTLQMGAGGTTGSLSSGSAITNNGTLAFNRSDTITQGTDFKNVISGSGAVTQAGTGTLVLNGTNTFTGLTTVSHGILEVTANNALGTNAAGTSVASGAALKLTGVNYSTSEALTLNGSGISNGGALLNSGTSTYAGQITAATNATINAGGGTLNLTGGW